MKILVCGMPRSMTTWAFNAIRELVRAPEARLLWIEPASPDEAVFAQSAGMVIGKCHHFSPALAEAADIVVYSYRDLRTAAVSAYRKFGATGSREQLETWIAVERLWLLHADLVIRYEDVEADPRAGLRRIADLLSARGVAISSESGDAILSRIDEAFSRREKASGPGFDAETLILAGHRTFQPAADLLPPDERAMYVRVEEQFAGWLQSHGYLDGCAAHPPQVGDPLGAYLAALMREAAAKEEEMRLTAKRDADREQVEAARERAESQLRAALADLEAKQAVLDEALQALQAYRAAFAVMGWALGPLEKVLRLGKHHVFRYVGPKLGVLQQHAPKALDLPRGYGRSTAPAAAPRISIVTPSFRQSRFIERTIRSVLEQGYPNLEYFVQDGASDDGTREILERYADRLAGWDSSPDSGQTQAINRGFAHTTGEIMAWLNSDDVLLPGALAYVADFFARHPDVDVIYGNRILIDDDDRQIGMWILPAHDEKVLAWADFIPQETLFWRRAAWDRAGARVDEAFRFAMDWDLLVRFQEAGARFRHVPRFLAGFRIHPEQKTSATISDVGFREMDLIRKRKLGRVPSSVEVRKAVMPYLMRHVAVDIAWRLRHKVGVAP